MRKYEVMLAFETPSMRNHHVEADGIGYHSDGNQQVAILYVRDGDEERSVFVAPVAMLAYVREIVETDAEAKARDLQRRLDEITDLEPVTLVDVPGVSDGDYVRRDDVMSIAIQY